ncbi:PREDICTED: uncharacterized N-acetyltransferase C9.02c-like [Branchiostoma belcheri]|uniref:Serotonin N-acetyltransferase n=1 Tax=Branchiostoma belcheri TaxID=7741 RepID=A0A6P4YBG7_BRABE|nr:PREDICTED: uncharacterized N-acetyltransferase C9.02c-like [Branchiostoma belcheri]
MTEGIIRPLQCTKEVEEASILESAGYPADEAASLETLQMRYTAESRLFLGYFKNEKLLGFVCATSTNADHLTEESMHAHIPCGETVCIHSVCVDQSVKRQGIATKLLQAFVPHVKDSFPKAKRICLICHEYLIPLYTKAGFVLVGTSEVVHGKEAWYECIMEL